MKEAGDSRLHGLELTFVFYKSNRSGGVVNKSHYRMPNFGLACFEVMLDATSEFVGLE